MTHYFRDDKFVISCAARTGSTMLVHLLRSHPHVLCHGEVFGLDGIGMVAGAYAPRRREREFDEAFVEFARADPVRFLYDIVFFPQGRRIVGFKFKTDEAFRPEFEHVRAALASDRSVKIVHLLRYNLLDQYISHQVVLKQTGITMLQREQERPRVEPFEIDVEDCVAYVEDVRSRQHRAEAMYATHRSFLVHYENIVEQGDACLAPLQVFLGIEPVPLRTTTKRILPSSREIVSNYDAALDALVRAGLQGR